MQGTNPSHHMLDVISAETRDSNSILDCQDNSMAETSTLLLGLFSSSWSRFHFSVGPAAQRMLHPLHDAWQPHPFLIFRSRSRFRSLFGFRLFHLPQSSVALQQLFLPRARMRSEGLCDRSWCPGGVYKSTLFFGTNLLSLKILTFIGLF